MLRFLEALTVLVTESYSEVGCLWNVGVFQEAMIISRKNIHDCVAEEANVQLLFEVSVQKDAIPLDGALLPALLY